MSAQDDNPTRVQFARWRNGDEAAFAIVHARLSPLLLVRVRRHRLWPLLTKVHDVDDVVQEIWARAVPALKASFQETGPGSLLAFVGTIADREIVDLSRRQRARKRGNGGAEALATGFETVDASRVGRSAPETPTGKARVSELTAIARQELTPREFDAWDLVEMQDFTAEEAALALRCSGSAVRGLLLRARARLVARLVRGWTTQANERQTSSDSDP